MKTKEEGKKQYILGLKGLACLLVMCGHLLGIYKYAESFPSITVLNRILNTRFSFIIDEVYWLYMFFVVSGYLVAKSSINSMWDVFRKIINRFFRLALPIIGAYVIIYFIYTVFGFCAFATVDLFQCKWYQETYLSNYYIKDVILGGSNVLIKGISDLNGPYYCLRDMFISSISIYFLKLYYNWMEEKKRDMFCFTSLMMAILASTFVSPIITACFIGMIISFYEKEGVGSKTYYAFGVMFVLFLMYTLPKAFLSSIFFGSLIIFIPRVKWLDRILSSRIFQYCGKISWGVFSFHHPIMCSVGAITLIELAKTIGLEKAYFTTILVVIIITLVLATAFFYSFEKISIWVCKQIDKCLGRMIDKKLSRLYVW